MAIIETIVTTQKRKAAAGNAVSATRMVSEKSRIGEQMDRDHAESERLKTETQVINDRTAVTLSRLEGQIKQLSKAV